MEMKNDDVSGAVTVVVDGQVIVGPRPEEFLGVTTGGMITVARDWQERYGLVRVLHAGFSEFGRPLAGFVLN